MVSFSVYHLNIDRDVSTTYFRSLSGDSVDLLE